MWKYGGFHLRIGQYRHRGIREDQRMGPDRTSIVEKQEKGPRSIFEGWNLQGRVFDCYNITKSFNKLGIKESPLSFWIKSIIHDFGWISTSEVLETEGKFSPPRKKYIKASTQRR